MDGVVFAQKFSDLNELANAVQAAASHMANGPYGVRAEEVYAQKSKSDYELRVVAEVLTDGSTAYNFFIKDLNVG